jgi:hypothetical protein
VGSGGGIVPDGDVWLIAKLVSAAARTAEQVYDVNLLDDQLVLGIKGTLSVVELKVLEMRLLQGTEAKALLPPGYVTDGSGRVVKHPNARVREAIALVFRKFRETGSPRGGRGSRGRDGSPTGAPPAGGPGGCGSGAPPGVAWE